MPEYLFKTDEFGCTSAGIHLLRNKFNYETINYSDVMIARIERAKELHNWFVIFLIGAVIVFFGVYFCIGAIQVLGSDGLSIRHARICFFFLIPVGGGYFVFNSLRTGWVLRLTCRNGSRHKLPLRAIVNEKRLTDFKKHIHETIGTNDTYVGSVV